MKIVTKLKISTIISVAVVFLIGMTLNYERQLDDQLGGASKTAENLVKEVFEMNILVYDYMLKQPESRKRIYTQWKLETDSLTCLLTSLKSKYPKQQRILDDLSDNLKGLDKLFREISKIHDKQTVSGNGLSLELEGHLISQILTRSQTVVSLSSQFYDTNYERLSTIHHRSHILILLSVIISTLFIMFVSHLINQGVAKPIKKLTDGMELIGKGNLDYKLDMRDDNELGQLANKFDLMISQLKELTVSRDILITEISERKKAEKEQQKMKNRFILLSEATTEAIAITERGYVVDANEQMKQIFGYEIEEMKGMPAADFVVPEERERVKNIIASGYEKRYETTGLRKDGVTVDLSIHGRMLVSEGANIRMTSIRDITDYKLKEAAMIQAKDEWEKTFNAIPDLLMILDKNHRVLKINEAMAKKVNATPESLIGKLCYEEFHDSKTPGNCPHKQTMEDALQHSIETYEGNTNEYYFVTTTPLFNRDGSIFGSIHIARDITYLKNIQNALKESEDQLKTKNYILDRLNKNLEELVKNKVDEIREKEKLLMQQSKMAAMGDMIAAIAHQWKQPLNVVSIYIQDIKDAFRYNELDAGYIDNFVKKSLQQVNFMSKTIDDFKNFFKPSKEKETFDLIGISADVFSIMSSQFNSNMIDYRITCHTHDKTFTDFSRVIPCEATVVSTYKSHLSHVILNIINNAKDAIIERRNQGVISKDDRGLISIDIYKDNDILRMEISDNGGGIPQEIMDKIFDQYFTTKDSGKGTGIGLYMSKMIIEDSIGGKIYAKNIDGGAVFTIELVTSTK
ncbi:MAG: PAS domain-containing protein [Nitrospirae bacterium YQR-1]